MKQATKNIPRWILAFIGSLLLFATIALICIRMTLFNQEFMINQVHKTDYVETIRKDMTRVFKTWAAEVIFPLKFWSMLFQRRPFL